MIPVSFSVHSQITFSLVMGSVHSTLPPSEKHIVFSYLKFFDSLPFGQKSYLQTLSLFKSVILGHKQKILRVDVYSYFSILPSDFTTALRIREEFAKSVIIHICYCISYSLNRK